MADYANPESLVTTQWVADHGKDPNVRLVEVDVDTGGLSAGAHPGGSRLELAESTTANRSP